MKTIREIKHFEAGFDRTGVIELVIDTCCICEQEKVCVYIDGSEGEYGGASVCAECVKRECDNAS
ncbi:MAG: hypothetical protein ACXV8O_01490 [Methylobacter sp.]